MPSAPKILIENQNALGHNVEQVTLDTNRVNIQSETTDRFANIVAISSRGLWVDCSQWMVYSAGFFSAVKIAWMMRSPLWWIIIGAGVPLYILCIVISDVCLRRRSLLLHAAVRFTLLSLGGVIAFA